MNAWESIFLQSRVKDGCYAEDDIPQQNWAWPKGTWFKARLNQIRDHQPVINRKSHATVGQAIEPPTVH
jgi:hypothetical protein